MWLVVKRDAFILFSFSERRGSDNKLSIQRDLLYTNVVIVQTYASHLCWFYFTISRSKPFSKNGYWKSL